MKTFQELHKRVISEMARVGGRPAEHLPEDDQNRLRYLLNGITEGLKTGTINGEQILDEDGLPPKKVPQSQLFNRKMEYFFYCLTKLQKGPRLEKDNLKENIYANRTNWINYMKRYNIWAIHNGRTPSVAMAIFHKILENPIWFGSDEFEEMLLDSTNLGNYMSTISTNIRKPPLIVKQPWENSVRELTNRLLLPPKPKSQMTRLIQIKQSIMTLARDLAEERKTSAGDKFKIAHLLDEIAIGTARWREELENVMRQ